MYLQSNPLSPDPMTSRNGTIISTSGGEPICVMIPGWHGSESEHWQRRWSASMDGCVVVEQDDWDSPTPADWVTALDGTLKTVQRPVVLVAHSLGCITVAHWARRFGTANVAGALLVAPADVERPNGPPPLKRFAPIPRQSLPFPSVLIASTNDAAASAARAAEMAADWGSRFVCLKDAGHINVASGHGSWPEGRELLENWVRSLTPASRRPLLV